MSRTKKLQNKISIKQSKTSKKQSKKSNKQINTSKKQSKSFTARIIIKDNVGGIVVDKNTIKEIIENVVVK